MSVKQLCVLSVLACALASPGATSAADLSVNGHIRSDGACSIALGNGGVADFGNLLLKDVAHSYMRSDEMPLTINCQRQTKVGVKAIDNRKDMAHGSQKFGLSNPAIGGYLIYPKLSASAADEREVYVIHGYESSWGRTDAPWPPDGIVSWGTPDSEGPVAFKTLTTSLHVTVDVKDDIASTDVLEIDGSATLELVYL